MSNQFLLILNRVDLSSVKKPTLVSFCSCNSVCHGETCSTHPEMAFKPLHLVIVHMRVASVHTYHLLGQHFRLAACEATDAAVLDFALATCFGD